MGSNLAISFRLSVLIMGLAILSCGWCLFGLWPGDYCCVVGSRLLMVRSWGRPLLPEGAPLALFRRGTVACTDNHLRALVSFPSASLHLSWVFSAACWPSGLLPQARVRHSLDDRVFVFISCFFLINWITDRVYTNFIFVYVRPHRY